MDHHLGRTADLAMSTQACLAPILSPRADGAGPYLADGDEGGGDEGGGGHRFDRMANALISLAASTDVQENPLSTPAF